MTVFPPSPLHPPLDPLDLHHHMSLDDISPTSTLRRSTRDRKQRVVHADMSTPNRPSSYKSLPLKKYDVNDNDDEYIHTIIDDDSDCDADDDESDFDDTDNDDDYDIRSTASTSKSSSRRRHRAKPRRNILHARSISTVVERHAARKAERGNRAVVRRGTASLNEARRSLIETAAAALGKPGHPMSATLCHNMIHDINGRNDFKRGQCGINKKINGVLIPCCRTCKARPDNTFFLPATAEQRAATNLPSGRVMKDHDLEVSFTCFHCKNVFATKLVVADHYRSTESDCCGKEMKCICGKVAPKQDDFASTLTNLLEHAESGCRAAGSVPRQINVIRQRNITTPPTPYHLGTNDIDSEAAGWAIVNGMIDYITSDNPELTNMTSVTIMLQPGHFDNADGRFTNPTGQCFLRT
jgi:hypothetical protein